MKLDINGQFQNYRAHIDSNLWKNIFLQNFDDLRLPIVFLGFRNNFSTSDTTSYAILNILLVACFSDKNGQLTTCNLYRNFMELLMNMISHYYE